MQTPPSSTTCLCGQPKEPKAAHCTECMMWRELDYLSRSWKWDFRQKKGLP